ncbi:hypothetical protein EYF80_061438 [Liparis tanakae]|uniref:Uncharacterized protein n=1 Tax=Liparis tanakae TaxID=230148 RepID=A0A4Z2EHL6_9TELE|nr:hypothetical protein EYF80_061438 [Liparis tanakae]
MTRPTASSVLRTVQPLSSRFSLERASLLPLGWRLRAEVRGQGSEVRSPADREGEGLLTGPAGPSRDLDLL